MHQRQASKSFQEIRQFKIKFPFNLHFIPHPWLWCISIFKLVNFRLTVITEGRGRCLQCLCHQLSVMRLHVKESV